MLEKLTFFEVGTLRINQLFNNAQINLTIPDYQRPYVWSEEQIEEMLLDWEAHFFKDGALKPKTVEYYLGAIMIFEKDGKFEIIDGQQRLTTLLIMDFLWNKESSVLQEGKLQFNYRSQISHRKIKENKNFLLNRKDSLIAKNFNDIIAKLVVSVIITNSEDKAFVLFDSQNNRGMALDEIDFFKSYHLRELNEPKNYNYLKYFAKKFDSMNALNQTKNHNHSHLKTLNELFVKQLWRIRFWSKNQLFFPNRKLLLDTFQKKTVSFGKVDEIKLFPSFNNSLGATLVYNKQMKPEIKPHRKTFNYEGIEIPFTINQPIQKGIGFFLYTEKYTSIFNHIFREEKIEELVPITNLVYNVFNNYFINLYQIAIVQYFDKFNTERIEEFAKRVEHYLGAYRMNRFNIVAQAPIVLLRDYGNIFMDIQHSYLVVEVLDSLKKYVPEKYYNGYKYRIVSVNNIKSFLIQKNNNVDLTSARQNYYKSVKSFYKEFNGGKHKLTDKHYWIDESIIK